MKISAFFVNFQLNQIQNCSVQTKKMKNGIFSFQLKKKKYLCQLTEDDRHKDVPLPFDLTRILKSYHIKGMIEENSKKNWSNRYHMRWSLFTAITTKHFSVNSHKNFLVDMRWAGKKASEFLPSDRYFSFFWVVISMMHVLFKRL